MLKKYLKMPNWVNDKWSLKLQQQKNYNNFAPILHPLLEKFSNVRPLLCVTFPQGFQISKNFGHPTLGSGVKRRLNGTKREQTNTWTDGRTNWLIESIGP